MRCVLLLVLLSSLLLTGCMDLNLSLKIKGNRAGTGVVQLEMLEQMFQMMQVQGQQAGADFTLFEEDALRASLEEKKGRLKKFSNEVVDGVRKINIEISFADMHQFISQTGQHQMSLEEEKGSWVWRFMDNEMVNAFEEMDQALLEQQLAMITPTMVGLKWQIDLEVPVLVATNLNKIGQNQARYSLDFDRDIAEKSGREALDAFKAMLQPKWVRFKGVN